MCNLLIRSRFAQRIILTTYMLFPAFVFVADRVMTARFAAITGHLPSLSNYASYQLYNEVSLCNHDVVFSQWARIFHSEIVYSYTFLLLSASMLTLIIYSGVSKQFRFAIQLFAILAFYWIANGMAQSWTPLSVYYLIGYG